MIIGNIHSIENLGTMDGPGVRTVFFLQGCPLRCQYCHNPDTQSFEGGDQYSVEDILAYVKRYKPYFGQEGGVTFSGGEPLMQGAFLLEAVKALKEEGYHITLDTSGIGQSSYFEDILKYVDLVLLDIKHFETEEYFKLTGLSIRRTDAFVKALIASQTNVWIRHVMAPGETDNQRSMDLLFDYTKDLRNNIEKYEILPYHKLGVEKYSQLNLDYNWKDKAEMDSEVAMTYQNYLNQLLKRRLAI